MRDGIRLGKDCGRWQKAWRRARPGIMQTDPDYFGWWEQNALEAWPALSLRIRATTRVRPEAATRRSHFPAHNYRSAREEPAEP